MTDSAYRIEDQQRMTAAKNSFAWQSRLAARELGSRVLELGCGIGNFTEQLLGREAVIAVDVDADCIDCLRQRFGQRANLLPEVCDIGSDDLLKLARYRPDSCVALNVLEHVEDDRRVLNMLASILPRGGTIVLLLPAFSALYGPIDAKLGHFRRYSRGQVREIADAAPLKVRTLRYLNSVGFFGWWINAHVLRREAQSEAQIATFDRFVVPWMSRMEDKIRLPIGQSLLAVLEVA